MEGEGLASQGAASTTEEGGSVEYFESQNSQESVPLRMLLTTELMTVYPVQNPQGRRNYLHPGSGWLEWLTWDIRGNHVVIKHADGEYSLLAHLRKGSVAVSPGDHVKRGADPLSVLVVRVTVTLSVTVVLPDSNACCMNTTALRPLVNKCLRTIRTEGMWWTPSRYDVF